MAGQGFQIRKCHLPGNDTGHAMFTVTGAVDTQSGQQVKKMGREVFVKVVDGGLETRGQLRSVHMLRQMLKIKPGGSVRLPGSYRDALPLLLFWGFSFETDRCYHTSGWLVFSYHSLLSARITGLCHHSGSLFGDRVSRCPGWP